MNETKEKAKSFKKILRIIGISLIGLFGIVMLGGDKVTSGIMLLVTTGILLLPIQQNKTLRWVRIGFVCVVFCFVIWNISTTDLPTDNPFLPSPVKNPSEFSSTHFTGIRFIDQLIHIFNGFLEGRVFHAH